MSPKTPPLKVDLRSALDLLTVKILDLKRRTARNLYDICDWTVARLRVEDYDRM